MITDNPVERRLAAILAADVVGYSRMMGADEVGTLRALKNYRRDLIDPAITARHGRIVKTTGDGLLAEFPSAVDAAVCAVTIQRTVALCNTSLPEARRLTLRIGINVGDVIIDKGDIFGDGVNVAARLEGLCQPGGICISRTVHEQIDQKLPLAFEDLGEQTLKNIAHPIHVFSLAQHAIVAASDVAPSAVASSWFRRYASRAAKALEVMLALVVVVAAVWWASERQLFTAPSPKLGARASIAVLPFASLAADNAGGTSSDYFSDGLTEDIISALGRFRDLSVVSRGGVFAYKGKNPTPAEVGRDLKVRYVVEGSVRRTSDRIRVAATLTDTVRGTVLWSDRYDVDAKDIFSVQDRITTRISGMLAVKVTSLELARSAAKPPSGVEAYDLVLQGRDLLSRNTRSDNAQARTLFERAIMLDSGYAPAYIGLCRVNFYAVTQGWTFDARASFERAERLVRRAIELDDASSSAHALLGLILLNLGNNYDGALAEIRRAVELNSSDAEAYTGLLNILLWSGNIQGAIAAGEMLVQFQPRLSAVEAFDLGTAYLLAERSAEAVRILEPAVDANRTSSPVNVMLAAAYAQVGRQADAEHQAAVVHQRFPTFSSKDFGSLMRDPGQREKFALLLKKAGL
jgi:class 3 adenylate cyclase/TolB-like protein/tetratricopeptide (TPR) repeat protein